MEAAAKNPGGGASEGIGMGVGLAMANKMNESVNTPSAVTAATPPPVPAEPEFHMVIDGNSQGPFSLTQLKSKVKDHSLSGDTLVWADGMGEWARAASVPALAALIGSKPNQPPPVPKNL